MATLTTTPVIRTHGVWAMWTRWTVITTLGEFVGFSIPAVVGSVAAAALANQNNIAANLTMAAVMIVAGAGEGALLGLMQWLALRRYLPRLALRDWLGATVAGAVVAWAIGMLPSTLGDPSPLPPAILVVGGLVLGPALLCSIGFTQSRVLRRYVRDAGWWVPASAVAWLLGLTIVFGGMALIPDNASTPLVALISSLAGFGMGAVAAGVSGLGLVWILRLERRR